jgi:hypothetical protein
MALVVDVIVAPVEDAVVQAAAEAHGAMALAVDVVRVAAGVPVVGTGVHEARAANGLPVKLNARPGARSASDGVIRNGSVVQYAAP